MKKCNIFLWVILLVILDQAIKLIIHLSLMDSNFILVPNLLELKPVFNPSYSYWISKFGVNMGVIAHLAMFSLIWAIFIILYKFYHKVDTQNRLLDIALVFQTAGFASAYISIIFWKGGVLDFIDIKPLNVVCDLKDLYISIFVILWTISISIIAVKHHINTKDIIQYLKSLFTYKIK